jgi:rhodanese-related sulfurtransferase
MADMDMNSETMTHRLVDPDEFEVAVDQPNTVVINVHQPSDGEIEGTDLFMRFDDIDPAPLPFDHATVLAIYGKSNTMSAEAAVKLAALGYTNIVELDGGIDAWQASGRPVVRAARDD